jgi:lipopolysaccharide export system permease protein
MRARLAARYIFIEMLPGLVLGVVVFIFILLMFQALRLTEFVLVHGLSIRIVGEIMLYMSVSFLPAILPMSLLFAVLLTYARLSSDSEIVALKSVGLSTWHLLAPSLILGTLLSVLSAQTSFQIGPWGNRQFELLVTKLANSKVSATLREGTFSEGFFDLVIYADKIDGKTGHMSRVFIFDERDEKTPITVISKEGQIVQEANDFGGKTTLHLKDGNIHRSMLGNYTKVDFDGYDIQMTTQAGDSYREKSPQSLTYDDIVEGLKSKDVDPNRLLMFETEYHKRLALSLTCLTFSLIGVGLGTVTNRRAVKSSGIVYCIGVIVLYWAFFVASETLARQGVVPPWLSIWGVAVIFLAISIYSVKRVWD